MAGVIEKIFNEKMIEIAKEMIALGKLTLEEISKLCKLPLETVQKLATNISAETKGQI